MLQYTKEYISDIDNIHNILVEANKEWTKRKKLYEMKVRKVAPYNLVSADDKIMVEPFEAVISNMVNGYMGGKAPIYSVNEVPTEDKQKVLTKLFNKVFNKKEDEREEYQAFIDYIRNYNDDPYFYYKLVQDYNDMSAGYGIWYENKQNEIVYANVDARQSIAIYDFSTPVNKIGFLRSWEETDAKGNKFTRVILTTEDYKYSWRNNKLEEKTFYEDEEKEENNWGVVPCIAIENPDGLSCFELAKSNISAYERVINNSKNTFQYNDDAKLKVNGYNPVNAMFIEKTVNGETTVVKNPDRIKEDEMVLEAPVFYAGENGDMSWVEKNINDSALQNHKKTLVDLIFMISNCPNINDLGFTNADNSSALEKKFFPLEQSVCYLDKALRKELLAMWEAFTNRINLKKSTNYDFRNLKITLQRNMPTDKVSETSRVLQLKELLSEETLINMLPDELDARAELEKKKTESEDNFNDNLMNNIERAKQVKVEEETEQEQIEE